MSSSFGSTAEPSAASIDWTSRLVGPYRVLHRLGSGGMSEVYLAYHERLQRHAALKFLRKHLAADASHMQRFLQEAQAAARLVHPNIVQIYDIAEIDGVAYIAQEYVPGSTLRHYIQRCKMLPVDEAVSILLQVAAGLCKSAESSIVHRDIKPENILLTSSGDAKIVDFGLARALREVSDLTEVGVALGTPTYMSPEQIQGQSVDVRSDLYSLGVTAYHMLAGRPPFEGETALALALQHVQNRVPPLSEVRDDVPPGLQAIVERLLAKNPEDRYATPHALVEELRQLDVSQPTAAGRLPLPNLGESPVATFGEHTSALQRAMLQQAARGGGGRRSLSVAIVAVLALVAIGSGYLAYVAIVSQPIEDLLPEPTPYSLGIERQDSVASQYALALLKDTPAYWEAVEQYFPADTPANRSYHQKAWLRLAWLYLRQDDPEHAGKWIDKLLKPENLSGDKTIETLAHATDYWQAVELEDGQRAALSRTAAIEDYNSLTKEQQSLVQSAEALPSSIREIFYANRG